MLNVYIDDSQSNKDRNLFYLAGYFMTVREWGRFIDDWKKTLSCSPSIRCLHMKEANAFKGDFKDWSRPEKNAKLAALSAVIKKHQPYSVSCCISRKEYDEKKLGSG